MANVELGMQLFLQLSVILLICRLVGWLGCRYLGQTQVVMETLAGLRLGPSVLGLLAPDLQTFLLPQQLAMHTAAGPLLARGDLCAPHVGRPTVILCTILVLMAIVTTVMTAPLYSWLSRHERQPRLKTPAPSSCGS
ncbi:MAG: hypothetical protein AB7N91_20260 [Candidatus Tectimicrobiota bacterium]